MPRAPRKCPKQGCEQRITNTRYCEAHTEHHWVNGGTPRTTTPEHREQRLRILDRDNRTCQLRYPRRCIGVATEMDHRIPVHLGGTDNDDNMQSACEPCHAKKSSDEGNQARRR